VWRVVRRVLGLYLLFAVVGRFVEGIGAVRCGCAADCWCQRPVLSTFRWGVSVATSLAKRDLTPTGPQIGGL
jgi:hypothetical protein